MLELRQARPDDHAAIVTVVDDWWGRPVSGLLPRLFLDHFWTTSLVAEDDRGLAGFLVGFISPGAPEVGYVHFLGVRPDLRGSGLGRRLYAAFADTATDAGCRELRAITSPANEPSIGFHRSLGFAVSPPVPDHDGPGRAMVVFRRRLDGPQRS